ncbi:Trk family potassium uptake protein [Proteiniclasticum sp. SCR006]|uniref:Trk family potassium uptake protein n=1 Tax=Proteiniclasticum aestuarii TaxID=2817862 RepID=A0A939KEH6_9CLOT|nr:TrkH family potassium uptake protein [Proteiniclasticum aestuarii]MBO1263427.1 Trk family potassium uptake protein [Proteiniclasticum aestuarii]
MEELKKKRNMSPFKILAIGFLTVILTGAILLTLPISTQSGEVTSFLDSIFTATSAVCVTGLVVLDTGTYWSTFGQGVILTLIEIGGLGFMAMSTFFAMVLGKRISLRERLVMQEAYNTFSLQGIINHVRYMLLFTVSVQLFAALILMTQFIPVYGIGTGIYYGIFHAISAFNNAGFDLLGGFTSITIFNENKIILITLAIVINIGGLGYLVLREIISGVRAKRKLKNFSLHAKVVLTISGILLTVGTIAMLIFEWNNPATIEHMSFGNKLTNAFFSAVTPRTAGFNSISNSDMSPAGKLLTMGYMFVGGSPGSTAGGVKTTTLGIVIFTLISVLKGRQDAEVYKRRISQSVVFKAMAIFMLGITIVIIGVMILSITEIGASFETILYEVISAFGTVGLSQGLTPTLSSVGKVTIAIIMYLGRVGPLTVMLALAGKQEKINYKYPEGKILIG